MAVYL